MVGLSESLLWRGFGVKTTLTLPMATASGMSSFLRPQASCDFCLRGGVELARVAVPYFEATAELCPACREDFGRGGRRAAPFEPGFRVDRSWRWPRPDAGDARAALAGVEAPERDLARRLAGAVERGEELGPLAEVAAEVRRTARSDATALLLGIYAHATVASDRPPERRPPHKEKLAALDLAFGEYVAAAEYPIKTELGARIAALDILVKLERGEVAEAERKLRDAGAAVERARLREPRLPLLRAIVHAEQANLSGADRALEQCLKAIDAAPDGDAWRDVRAVALHDAFVRAVDGERFAAARDALRAYVKLRPDDRAARFALAHTYMKLSLDAVAREVLASVLDPEARDLIRGVHEQDPGDEEGLLLYATCLHRLGEPGRALALLADDEGVVPELPGERLRAERCHLAGLCAREKGDRGRALGLLAEAYEGVRTAGAEAERRPARALASDLVLAVQDEARERLEDLTADGLPGLVELVSAHAAAFRADYSPAGLELARRFVAWEMGRGFRSYVTGPDPLDSASLPGEHASLAQAYVLLAKRRLGEAVRKEREARAAGSSPVPIDLLLTLLDRLRRFTREGLEITLEEDEGDEGGGSGGEGGGGEGGGEGSP